MENKNMLKSMKCPVKFLLKKIRLQRNNAIKEITLAIFQEGAAYNRPVTISFLRIRSFGPRLKIKDVVPARSARRMIKKFPMINHSSPAKRQKCSPT